jgi:hypothetical protein
MRVLRAGALYLALTALLTYPLALRLAIMDAGDSAFFTWVMAWEAHALKTDPGRLPHGNMFHPLRYTLGMDEPILGTTLLVLPLYVFTDDAVLVFNVARLLTFVLSALTAYLLARHLGAAELPALIAGAAFAFSPIRIDQIAHLSTLGTQYLPLVLLFLFRFFGLGRTRDALLAALFFVLEAYACGYHGVVGLLVLPVAAIPVLWGRWGRLPVALIAAAAAALGLLPLYLLHHAALAPLHYTRGPEETAQRLHSRQHRHGQHQAGEEVVRVRRAEGRRRLAPHVVPRAGGEERLDGGRELRRFLRPARVVQRRQGRVVQQVEGEEAESGRGGGDQGDRQPTPASP